MPRCASGTRAPASLLCFHTDARGRTEVYGESESRARCFSAEFSGSARTRHRALPGGTADRRGRSRPSPLSEVLPLPSGAAMRSRSVAAGVCGRHRRLGCARAKFANLLPPERRASHDRLQYLIPGVLGVLLVLALADCVCDLPRPRTDGAIARISSARRGRSNRR